MGINKHGIKGEEVRSYLCLALFVHQQHNHIDELNFCYLHTLCEIRNDRYHELFDGIGIY